MDHTSSTFLIIMGIIIALGILGTAIYYFARFAFRTDFDKDIEEARKLKPDRLKAPEPDTLTEGRLREKATESVQPEAFEAPKAVVFEPTPKDLGSALEKTRSTLFGRIKDVFSRGGQLSQDDLESLEEILYTSDLGPHTVQRLMDAVSEKLSGTEKSNIEAVRDALKSEMRDIFLELNSEESEDIKGVLHLGREEKPQVWMVVGVNGVGKTTTIGKLANIVARSGKKVMVAAGDTFRAAAGDQLKVWSERAAVEIFSPPNVKDPSAVAFDACQSAQAQGFDIVIIDTAGRLHTQQNLMEELRKMKRVVQKVVPDGPHEVLLVLDANSGQNALVQAKFFNEALDLTGVVLTKLDGSAKGGVAVGLACELGLPIRLVGVGEGIDDIRPFSSQEFVSSIL